MKIVKILIFLYSLILPKLVFSGIFGPSTYEECLIENLKNVTNNSAVILITQSCRQKFPERKQVVDSSPKITDICKIYWNGKEFKKGDASNNAEFKIIKIAGYEVEVINIGFPKAMYDEFKFEDNKGKALGGPYKGGNFMSENFQKILDICDIKS